MTKTIYREPSDRQVDIRDLYLKLLPGSGEERYVYKERKIADEYLFKITNGAIGDYNEFSGFLRNQAKKSDAWLYTVEQIFTRLEKYMWNYRMKKAQEELNAKYGSGLTVKIS